eukprot:COSAG04_NODE_1379_length_7006_cov_71.155350_1_plen_124_part_10
MLRTDLDGRYTTAYPKLRGLGTALISFAGLTLFLAPGLRLGARWNRLGQAVKTRKKREKTGNSPRRSTRPTRQTATLSAKRPSVKASGRSTSPIISVRWGWQAVCYAYGGVSLGFAVLWGLLAR